MTDETSRESINDMDETDNLEEEEKSAMTLSGLGAVIGFIVPLIIWINQKQEFSKYAKNFLIDILNFEISMTVLFFALSFVPYSHKTIYTILFAINFIISLRAFSSARERKPYNFPIKIKFIK